MTKREKKPARGIIPGLLGLALTGWLVINWEPGVWWKEVVVVICGFVSLLLITSWSLGNKRCGALITTLIFGVLLLNRLGIFDILTLILLVAVLGLISLID
jgi:hypothetical protein